jgi:hypothetical protein
VHTVEVVFDVVHDAAQLDRFRLTVLAEPRRQQGGTGDATGDDGTSAVFDVDLPS